MNCSCWTNMTRKLDLSGRTMAATRERSAPPPPQSQEFYTGMQIGWLVPVSVPVLCTTHIHTYNRVAV